jgi:SAM-dependent methyltransferase
VDLSDCGTSLAKPSKIIDIASAIDGVRIIGYIERRWVDTHDVLVLSKNDRPQTSGLMAHSMSFEQALTLCPQHALQHNVRHEVHPEDFLFHFLIGNSSFKSINDGVAYYFDDGARCAGKLRNLLIDVCGWQGAPTKLLEFASGYGRVTRHYQRVLPEIAVTSCDIHPEAVRFIAKHFGVEGVLSSSIPEQLNVPEEYDIVFALSFLSHMPRTSWPTWYKALLSKVKKGGIFIFTTHGWLSRKFLGFSDFDEDGFWFAPRSEQEDLETSSYGIAATSPVFVIKQAAKSPGGRLVCFREGYWWDHQDLYVFTREAD